MTVATGLDRIKHDCAHRLRDRSVALLAHPASVDAQLRPALQVLREAGAKVVALLGPEHGVGGEAQDMEQVDHDSRSAGPRIHSLYGTSEASLRPTAEMLENVEILVVDLQDIGTRYYTYVWTAALCLESCAEQGITMLVLDRPNPITGEYVEGPAIEAGFRSFVGLHDVATRHGMTLGEIVSLYAKEKGLVDHLEVIAMKGYQRRLWFDETGLPWVLPSPNMPTAETALVYAGMCLLEGTNLSEGRGSTRPFEIVGAPWVDGEALASMLCAEELPGCAFRPLRFKPMFHKHAGELCGGVQTYVTNREIYRSLRTGVALVRSLWQLGGRGNKEMEWRTEPYEFIKDRLAIDLLAGGKWLREGVESGATVEEICQSWKTQEIGFRERRAEVLLYKNR